MRLLMDRGMDRGYLPNPAKSIFIADKPEDKELTKKELDWEVLNINDVDVGRYLGAFMRPMEELDEWVWTKVEA